MKRITYKIIIISILLIVNVCAFAQQIYYLNNPDGYFSSSPIDSMSVGGTRTKTWYINTGSQTPVDIYYTFDLLKNVDFLDIYAISGDGSEYLIKTLTGTDDGDITTGLPSGKAKVQFRIYSGSAGCNYYGIDISYGQIYSTTVTSEIETSISKNAFVSQNLSAFGNVGIGTGSSDSYKLLITGNNPFGIYSYNNNKSGNTYGISSYAISNASVYGIYSYAASSMSNANIYGIYSTISGPSAANKWAGYFNGGKVQVNSGDLLITGGKVGIGTTTPQNALDVYGSVYLPANNSYWIGSYSDSGNRLRMHHNGYNAYIDYLPNLYFRANGTVEALTLLQNGNVGIGTSNPQNKLEINGNIKASSLSLDGTCQISGSGEVGNGVSIVNLNKTLAGQAREWKIYNMTGNYGNSLQFWAYDAVNACGGGMCDSRLTIMDNGNIGIGVGNPVNKLDVNGAIRAKEVKIETGWADFVFKDNYLLKPLQEVNEYIKTNKRLPDIPSEQEVKETGVNLGDMQTKLLQKIEELTLYTIQQQEMIDKLNARIEKLENK